MTNSKNTLSYMEHQAQLLNRASRQNSGNSVLSAWLKESAKYFEQKCSDINKTLDSMSLGSYKESRKNRKETYASDWYAYEEEYAYNFSGDN